MGRVRSGLLALLGVGLLAACGGGGGGDGGGGQPPPANQAPTLTSVSFSIIQGRTLNGQLTATDPEGGALTFASASNPASGTLTVQSTGAFTYTPNTGFTGSDTFQARVSDAQGAAGTATVTITVAANRPPTANNAVVSVASAATIDVALAAFATDPDGDALTASVVGAPFGAGATANGNTLRLTPPTAAFRGVVRLQYRVTDLSNAQSAPATLLAFVGTQPFQVAYLGNDFATARTDLVLTDLVSDTRQVNPTLAAGAITRFEVSDNAQSFSYVVGQGDAFVVRATTLGTATALFPAALDPQSVHVRTALSPDGARACATYFDGSNPSASALRWRSFVTTVATGARAEVTPDNRVCFGFVNGGADILFLGTNNVVPGDDPAIYRAPAASPTGIAGSPSRLTTLTYEANAGWSLDSVFVASDGSRMLYVQKRAGLESVYHLPLGAGGTDAAISTAFTRIFDLAASPSRDRVAFLAAGQNTDLWGADIAAAGTSTLLFAVPAGRSLAAPVFSPDGTRVAFAANSATAQPDIYDAEFANPMGVTQALGGVEADAPTLRYDASGANLIVSSASTGSASQFRISQAVRGGPPTQSPTVLHPVSQFLGASRSFALTTDSAVVVAALRDAGSGDVRVYLVNRAVPGEALLLSRTTATQASGVRVVAR